jgi:hypothetical protein
MNKYLKTGGRLVGVIVFAAGVLLAATSAWLICEAIANWSPGPAYNSPIWPEHAIEAGFICGVFAGLCFRYCARLRREERDGVQI